MSQQDWTPVVITKNKPGDKKPQPTMTNQQKALLEDDGEVHKVKYVDRELAQEITKARVAKGLTRKQLANGMAIQECIVADYENAKAVYNGAMVNKFKTYLGIGKTPSK
jgi:ribosome-binding protein aMBF1 (putative translation factor)